MGEPSSPASFIRLVQKLIEQCLIFRMNKDECMDALAKHANISSVVTATVWKELEKENKEFFEAYVKVQEEKAEATQTEVVERFKKILADIDAAKDPNKKDD